MNFEFSDEQNQLRDHAQRFLGERCPPGTVRAILDDPDTPYDRDLWREMAELGWTGVTIPEQFGGSGLGYLELCVIAEELGRSLAPTPYATSVYLATEALLRFGSEAQQQKYLPGLAAGETIGTVAVAEGRGVPTPDNLKTTADNNQLSGDKWPVPDGDVADFAIVLANDGGDASLMLVDLSDDTISRKTLQSIDPTRSQARIAFDRTASEPLGTPGNGWSNLRSLFDRAAVLYAFEQCGGASAALEMARSYVTERYAFGRPIGGYQAIKHKLADMYIAATLARSNCYYGAWALSTDAPELPLAAATARVSATQAYTECSAENIQAHGGMGFTWEFDCHMYYRRAKALAVNLGSQSRWEDRLVTALAAEHKMEASA